MDKDFDEIVSKVDFVFCAVNMPKDQIKAIEERYAKAEVPVVSNNSANRWTPDVPMVVPEINPEHLEVIKYQRERLGTKRGFICVKPNCSIQSYTPALNALKEFGPKLVVATTYQAISGAGKTFEQIKRTVEKECNNGKFGVTIEYGIAMRKASNRWIMDIVHEAVNDMRDRKGR